MSDGLLGGRRPKVCGSGSASQNPPHWDCWGGRGCTHAGGLCLIKRGVFCLVCQTWMLAGQGQAGRPPSPLDWDGVLGEGKNKRAASRIDRWDCQIELRSLFVSPKSSHLLARRQNTGRH